MIASKVLGITIVNSIYNLDFYIDNQIRGLFTVQLYYTDIETTLLVNSFANLFMILTLAFPTFYFIFKTSVYQSTLQNPRTIVKLTKFNVVKWITKKDTSFLLIFIWSSFLLLASLLVIVETLQGNCYSWVGIIAGVFSLLSMWGTVKTYEVEIDKIYPTEEKFY